MITPPPMAFDLFARAREIMLVMMMLFIDQVLIIDSIDIVVMVLVDVL